MLLLLVRNERLNVLYIRVISDSCTAQDSLALVILLRESMSLICVLEFYLSAAGNAETLLGAGMSFDLRHKFILLKF